VQDGQAVADLPVFSCRAHRASVVSGSPGVNDLRQFQRVLPSGPAFDIRVNRVCVHRVGTVVVAVLWTVVLAHDMERFKPSIPSGAMSPPVEPLAAAARSQTARLGRLARYRRLVELHDSVLLRLGIEWEAGVLSMDLRVAESDVTIRASGLRKLSVVWAFPGTQSRPIDRVDVGHEKLNLEMQGGGHIRVEAASIDMP
jgi:hypothetical protein